MKSLALLRHASSGWPNETSDFDRPLDARGRREGIAVGRHLRSQRIGFDLVLASPARRVVETIDQVEQGLGKSLAARFDPRLYLASVATLIDVARETDVAVERLLFVGHNPAIGALVPLLAGPNAGVVQDYPTGALTEIIFEIGIWSEVGPGAGRIEHFIRPSDLDVAQE